MEKTKKFGFEQVDISDIKELETSAYRFRHEKSGADVLILKNADENRVFGIGFRTPQENSTGVPHILEHSVLNGSRKYKTKEPFMDMARTSLSTFLNAMTFPDKTIYPIASRNEQDYRNLMDVYLDAVFFPVLHENEKIFQQEGWRYHILDKDEPLTYSGVVYNEMRGAYSSAGSIIYREVVKGLFPDTHYANDSGGEPYTIPELTYEDFCNFHKQYYAPSNSKIFLYGDIDIDYYLEYLDTEYLSHFDFVDIDSSIKVQDAFAEKQIVQLEYSLSPDEDVNQKDYFAYAVASNQYSDIKENLILEILIDALFANTSSPVKLALEKAGLAQDVSAFNDNMNQSYLAVVLQNAKEDAEEEMQSIIESTLRKLIDEGIDKELIRASLNRLEFSLREGGSFSTKGILYFIKSLDTWLYGGDPLDALRYENILSEIREDINSNIWEEFVEENILNNPHKLIVHLKPVAGLNDKKDKEVHAMLQDKKAKMSEDELNALIEANEALKAWQDAEDTEEIKATMPKLALADIDTKLPDPPCLVEPLESDVLLKHGLFTSSIHYGRLSFPINHLSLDELFYAQFLTDVLAEVDTENYSYEDLGIQIFLCSGGIGFSNNLVRKRDKTLDLRLEVNWKTLNASDTKWAELLEEIILRSRLNDEKRLLELIKMQVVGREQAIMGSGNQYATTRALSKIMLAEQVADRIGGIDYYLKLKDLSKHFDERKDTFISELIEVYKKIFVKGDVVLSLTTDEADMEAFANTAVKALKALPTDEKKNVEWVFEGSKSNEGIMSSSNVQYVVKAFNFENLDQEYSGDMAVLSTLLSRTYLHNNIRAAGGAYGTGLSITESANIAASSYRDPHLTRTLGVYDEMANWLEANALSDADVEQYIIGSINRFDPPLTPYAQGRLACNRYLSGKTVKDLEEQLNQALEVSPDKLKAFAKLIDTSMQEAIVCVIGNSEVIKEHKELFDEMISL